MLVALKRNETPLGPVRECVTQKDLVTSTSADGVCSLLGKILETDLNPGCLHDMMSVLQSVSGRSHRAQSSQKLACRARHNRRDRGWDSVGETKAGRVQSVGTTGY